MGEVVQWLFSAIVFVYHTIVCTVNWIVLHQGQIAFCLYLVDKAVWLTPTKKDDFVRDVLWRGLSMVTGKSIQQLRRFKWYRRKK